MLFDNMLIRTGQDSSFISSHEDSVLSHLISQRSDLILVLVSCQAWTGSFRPGLVPFHPGFMPGWDRTETEYSNSGSQSNSDYLIIEFMIFFLEYFEQQILKFTVE